MYYSFLLEYADGGALEKHLRTNVRALIKWEIQLKSIYFFEGSKERIRKKKNGYTIIKGLF